jgi:hypothetical protein
MERWDVEVESSRPKYVRKEWTRRILEETQLPYFRMISRVSFSRRTRVP